MLPDEIHSRFSPMDKAIRAISLLGESEIHFYLSLALSKKARHDARQVLGSTRTLHPSRFTFCSLRVINHRVAIGKKDKMVLSLSEGNVGVFDHELFSNEFFEGTVRVDFEKS